MRDKMTRKKKLRKSRDKKTPETWSQQSYRAVASWQSTLGGRRLGGCGRANTAPGDGGGLTGSNGNTAGGGTTGP